jgi:hypothetical protein
MTAPWLRFFTTYLRVPDTWEVDDTGAIAATFVPPLTTEEQAIFADLQTMAKFTIASDISLAEFRAIKPDLALGRAFLGISSPTNAQAVAAEKAIIRVIGALLRNA